MDWKLDLDFFRKHKRKVLEGTLDMDYLELDLGRMKVLEPIVVKIVAVKTKIGVAVGGYVKTAIEHPCTRCLTPVRVEINGTVEALFVPKEFERSGGEVQLESLKNVIYYTKPIVDLRDRIVEAMVLEVPQRVLCRPDCKGLCPYCGINLNDHPDHVCGESREFVNPKFAVLAKFKFGEGEG